MSENLDYESLWKEMLTDIRSEVGDQVFNRWFNLEFTGFSEDKIFVSAPSKVHIDQINLRYPQLNIKLKEITGKDLSITISAETSDMPSEAAPENKNQTQAKIEKRQKPEEKAAVAPAHKPAAPKIQRLHLLEEFVFDNYVIGDNNDFAVNAALAVSRNPGAVNEYNPLLIYGGVGLGKTHLIQAIGNYIHDVSEQKVVYTAAETFTNEFIESVKNQTMTAFKKKYRSTDLLLIDDIHFLQKKESCQEELFNTFNALRSSKKQMVFTCDRPVVELRDFTERLKSRLGSGLQVDIQIPNYETRCAILIKKIEASKISIPDDVIDLICRNISTNIRDMVSALNKLVGYAGLTKKQITLEAAGKLLKDIFSSPRQSNISIDTIIQVIATHFDLSTSDIKSKKKSKNIVYPRQLAMFIARTITELSTTEVGEAFSKDHTTVIHAVEKIEERKHSDPTEETRIQNLIKMIREQSVK